MQLYTVNTTLFVVILAGVLLHLLTASSWRSEFPPFFSEPWSALFKGLVLLYRPGYLDILPMYILFLLVVTPALAAIRASRAWMVMGLSALVWLWVQISAPESKSLNPFGYQILFMAGLVIGSSPDAQAHLSNAKVTRIAQVSLVLAACLLLFRLGFGLLRIPELAGPGWHTLVHLENNGPLRVVNFALFALGAAYVWPRISAEIKSSALLRWIAYLGQHSLQVFAWSVAVTYISMAVMPDHPSRLWSAMDILLTVSSLWIPAGLHAWFRQRNQTYALEAT